MKTGVFLMSASLAAVQLVGWRGLHGEPRKCVVEDAGVGAIERRLAGVGLHLFWEPQATNAVAPRRDPA